jgi:membrane protein implicated in regulation of membrane protease activity
MAHESWRQSSSHESLGDSALVRALTDLLADLSDLIQKELRLARAEITQKLTVGIRGGLWMAAAGLLAFVALLFVLEGVVFALASAGMPLQWSCFLVAAVIAVTAALAFYAGRSPADTRLAPRATRQFGETLRTAKEQLK